MTDEKTQVAAPTAPEVTNPGNNPSFSEMLSLAEAEAGGSPSAAVAEAPTTEPAAVAGNAEEPVSPDAAPESSASVATEPADTVEEPAADTPAAPKAEEPKPVALKIKGYDTTPDEVERVLDAQGEFLKEARAELEQLRAWKEEQTEAARLERESALQAVAAYNNWRLERREQGLAEDIGSFQADMAARGIDFSPKKPVPKQETEEEKFERLYNARRAKEADEGRRTRADQIRKNVPSWVEAEARKHPALKNAVRLYGLRIEADAGQILAKKGYSLANLGALGDQEIQTAIAQATAIVAKEAAGLRLAQTGELLDEHAKTQKQIPSVPKNGATALPRKPRGMDFDVERVANENKYDLGAMLRAAKEANETEIAEIRRNATDKIRR